MIERSIFKITTDSDDIDSSICILHYYWSYFLHLFAFSIVICLFLYLVIVICLFNYLQLPLHCKDAVD